MSRARFRRGRRRRIPRIRADGQYYGYGREKEDAISGWLFPVTFMTKQCGGEVSRFYRDGSFDYSDGPRDNICTPTAVDRPLLSIEATDPDAVRPSSPAETGMFTIFRSGDTTHDLHINLRITGTATSGVDYVPIDTSVTMLAGVTEQDLTVTPLADPSSPDPETVTVTILPDIDLQTYYLDYTKTPRPNVDFPTQTAPDDFIFTLNNTATVNIHQPATPPTVALLMRYEFNISSGFLVNSGTAGATYNLSSGDICLG